MTKLVAEGLNTINIFFLKKEGFLPQQNQYRRDRLTWTGVGEKNSINIAIQTSGEEEETINSSYIEFNYTINSRIVEMEKEHIKYKMPLVTTPCNYGGKRYWFICNLSKNGVYCGRRVGVLYNSSKYFACCHCSDVAYSAQFKSKRFRFGSVCEPDVEKAYVDIKTFYYNGKPTKKYKKYLRLKEKMDNSWTQMLLNIANNKYLDNK
jgi:hypothetical protein